MVSQLSFDIFNSYVAVKSEKEEEQPQWDKFYALYAFDEIKYHKLLEGYIKDNNLKGIYDIDKQLLADYKEQCYVLNEYGEKKPLGDEKHIFKYKLLQKLYEEIAKYVSYPLSLEDSIFKQDGLIVYISHFKKGQYKWFDIDKRKENTFTGRKFNIIQAEIENTWDLPIKDRVLLHIKLLRLLKQGYKVKDSIKQIKERE